jgi:hypothetical protein
VVIIFKKRFATMPTIYYEILAASSLCEKHHYSCKSILNVFLGCVLKGNVRWPVHDSRSRNYFYCLTDAIDVGFEWVCRHF